MASRNGTAPRNTASHVERGGPYIDVRPFAEVFAKRRRLEGLTAGQLAVRISEIPGAGSWDRARVDRTFALKPAKDSGVLRVHRWQQKVSYPVALLLCAALDCDPCDFAEYGL